MTTRSAPDTLAADALTVLQAGFTGTTAPEWLLRRLREGLGAVALFARNIETPEQLKALTAQFRAVRPDVLVAADEEGGDVTRLEARDGSSFPGNLALGAVDDRDLTEDVAAELGRRLAACGVNLNWAPSADVNSDPGNPVIGVRSFGAEPGLVARHTAAYVRGLQSAGVAACTKHFPGHGDTAVDSHHALPRIDADLETLHHRELVPFRAALAAGTKVVMSAHIVVPALDPERPATLSPAILTGLLRAPESEGGLGYGGLIVTDGIEMQAIAATYGVERGTVMALAAGADAICVGGGLADDDTVVRLRDAITSAVRDGRLTRERLADAAARVRALAAWTVEQAGEAAGIAPDTQVGLTAARRALRITRTATHQPIDRAPYVAGFTPAANIAVGEETPWGVAAELERLLPGTETGAYRAADAEEHGVSEVCARVLRCAADRRIVAVVRDVHRHRWMADVLAALVAARPDTVVVEMGVPQAPPSGALYIATHGAARVCGRAAAEVITGNEAGARPARDTQVTHQEAHRMSATTPARQSRTPGRIMSGEMAEQPTVLRRILEQGAPRIRRIAAQVAVRNPRFVLLTGRGTSDNAALYAKYLIEVGLGKPAGLTSMSTTTAYGAEPDLTDVLVVTVSQSGGSPDLVASAKAARAAGAITVAVTNSPGSPLAEVSEFHIDVMAGPEKALPATKTYTAELLALYLFVEGLRGGDGSAAKVLPELAEQILARRDEVRELAGRYRFAERLVLTSRGYGYPTAKEAALKLMETSYIPALAFSGADLLHGPLAMVDNVSPVIAIVTEGKGGEALQPVLDRLRGRGADLVVIGNQAQVDAASAGFVLPTSGVAEELQPILEIIPLQMLAYEVTIARGQDPDAPRALAKVTETH